MLEHIYPNFPVPVLPEAYDESASYYQLLMKLVNKVNYVIDLANDDHTTVDEIRAQLEQILPYLDDLSHMGERFTEIQAEIDALIDRLYSPTDGDITYIQTQLTQIQGNIVEAATLARGANAVTMRTAQYAGLNALQEVQVPTQQTSHGLTFAKDSGTGFIHVTGTVTGLLGEPWAIQLGIYKTKAVYKSTPYSGNDPGSVGVLSHSGNKFAALFGFGVDIPSDRANLSITVRDNVNDNFLSSQNNTFVGTPSDYTDTDNNVKIEAIFQPELNGETIDVWICPTIYPAFLETPLAGTYAQYPLPVSDLTVTDLETQINAEATARENAINAEVVARQAADTQLQTNINGVSTRLEQEIAVRVANDNDFITMLNGETTARTNADSTLQTNINNVAQDLSDVAETMQTYGVGTIVADGTDLFTLDPGKYGKSTNPTNALNLPYGMTGAWYCEVVNTIAANRRKIYLYPATQGRAGEYYTCLETGSGYGAWYKWTGAEVIPPEP